MNKIKVGITMGDPSGVGPGIIAKALAKLKVRAEFTVIGDRGVFSLACARLPRGVNFVDLNNVSGRHFSFGKIRAEYGRASIEYLDTSLQLLEDKSIDCLVTSPISKEAVNLAGFPYTGHTEYFASRTRSKNVVMMLLNDRLKFALATRHIPLMKVAARLGNDTIFKTIVATHAALQDMFSLPRARIAVCALNPHASDNGLLGKEEIRLIVPQVAKAQRRIRVLKGPLPADSAVAGACRGEFDALIAMYHDQALIPLKITSPGTGVNLSLGLPFIRTSPLHGTGFDIAASGRADPSSLIRAIMLALRCTSNRKKA